MTRRSRMWLNAAFLGVLASAGARATSLGADRWLASSGDALAHCAAHQPSSLAAARPGLNASYALERRPSRAVAATYTYSVSLPNFTVDEWELFAPKPVDLPGQEILRTATSPEGIVVSDASPLRQPLYRARVQATSPELHRSVVFVIEIEARLFARRLIASVNSGQDVGPEALPEPQRLLAVRATSQFDYRNKRLQAWLTDQGLMRHDQEGEVDYARRVFQVIARDFEYDYRGEQDRSAVNVAATGKSDCGGLAALFVTALRSQGVAARTLAGRWAMSARPGQRMGSVAAYFQEHIKAEFFAPGVGWVPADLSSAILHDQSAEKLRYFGNDAGDFVTWHLDTDLAVDTRYFGRRNYVLLQRPCYWVIGAGSMQGVVTREEWTVRSAGPSDPPPRRAGQQPPERR